MNGSRLLLVIAIFVVVIVFMMIIASFPLMEMGPNRSGMHASYYPIVKTLIENLVHV